MFVFIIVCNDIIVTKFIFKEVQAGRTVSSKGTLNN